MAECAKPEIVMKSATVQSSEIMAECAESDEIVMKSATDSNVRLMSVKMLTWNLAGSRSENYFSEIRGKLVPIVRQLLPTDCISFSQELTNVTKMADWGFANIAASIEGGKKEAGVSTPQSGKFELGDILDDSKLKDLGIENEIFRKRMYGRKVTVMHKIGDSEFTGNITVVSYHAPYKTDGKKLKMIEYFQTMCDLADKLEQTIIIGGDFNLPVLDWKEEVEENFRGRVSVALYVGTPRRWVRDKVLDTFAIVQPRSKEHRTAESTFEKTMAIYPYPLAGRVGDGKETILSNYPSSENRWFKYVHFSKEDLQSVKEVLERKRESDIEKITKKIKVKEDEPSNRSRQQEMEIEQLKETKKEIEEKWLSEPFTNQQAPTPLWPNSPLDDVLDHDPVVTEIKVKLKRKPSTEKDTSATPTRPRATRQRK